MRIISGKLGGLTFDSPKGHKTHPMSEKARGGLFGVLGDIEYLTVLDAFAGSGALSFEAISRGAKHATLIDIDISAINTIVKNAEQLKISSKIKAVRANAGGWSNNNKDKKFDIIICDPPYDSLKYEAIEKLVRHMKGRSILVLSWPANIEIFKIKDLEIVKIKKYGDAQLVFYKKIR